MAKTTDGVNMTELDKFKRRMIRSVARLLLHEKRTEEEVWEEMKKETGCDCKVLWHRMRILTLKKLKRLLVADDRTDGIPAIAQMTLTDWLIFDLVIVHEKVDVIGEDKITANNVDSKALTELFTLVQRFHIEGREGDSLAEAWTAATVLYNTQGHQCSPMLMQRRWYQLKLLTRSRFYKFWFTYRGNARQLARAEEFTPSRLQRAIARRFPDIVTRPFLGWEELIAKKLVIMPEEFEHKMRMKNLPKPCDENAPDLVLLEPLIETIDLGLDSDSDEQENEAPEGAVDNTQTNVVQIKNEPEDLDTKDVEENVNTISKKIINSQQALEIVEQEELLLDNDDINDDREVCAPQEYNIINIVESNDTEVVPRVADNIKTEDSASSFDTHIPDESLEVIPKITSIFGSIDITNETLSQISFLTQAQMVPDKQCIQHTVERENIHQTVNFEGEEKEIIKENEPQMITEIKDKNADVVNDPIATELEQEIAARAESYISQSKMKDNNVSFLDTSISVTDFDDNGIEFVDDGIEYVDEDELLKNNPNDIDSVIQTDIKGGQANEPEKYSDDNDETRKFDLKLLMHPVVYTKKLDHMSVFKEMLSFDYVNDKNLLESIILESKPVSKKAVLVSQDKQGKEHLLLCEESRIHDDLFNPVFPSDSSEESEEEIDENRRVKLSSYLLQKPRSRSYNSIQLCKNPDFNTRLKRLPIGFFSSSRNRFLLKACKPMTIDVTKTFESKLIDGTLYLKATDKPVVVIDDKDNINKSTSVLPSAMAVQSLIDNTKLKDVLISPQHRYKASYPSQNYSPPDDGLERNKVINLPDIMQVRRINQRLLTAEVPPIRIESTNNMDKAIELANVIPTLTSKYEPVVENELNTINVEEDTSLISFTNSTDIRKIASQRHDVNKIIALNRESTRQPNVASDKDIPLGILKTPSSTILPSVIEAAQKKQTNPDVNEDRVTNIEGCNNNVNDNCIASNRAKEISHHIQNLNAVANTSAHETRTNDIRKVRSYGLPLSKCKAPTWRPLANDKNVPLSWINKPKYLETPKIDDSLLTLDTLSKMLMIIAGPDEQNTKKKNQKRVTKSSQVLNRSITESDKQSDPKDTDNDKTTTTRNKKTAKPKITIMYGNKSNPNYKGKHCCWVRNQLFCKEIKSVRRGRKHMCPANNCICCCKEALIKPTAIVLSDDEDEKLKNACKSIESVVQQTQDIVTEENKIHTRPTSTLTRPFSNRNATRRSIGTDPMEPSNSDKMHSNDISKTVWTISMNQGHVYRPCREAGNMVDIEKESPDVLFPQTVNPIPVSNVIEQISVPITPVASSVSIDCAAETLSLPAVTHTRTIESDYNVENTYSPNIKSKNQEITPHIQLIPNVSLNSPKRQLVIDGSKNFQIAQDFPSNENSSIAYKKFVYLNRKYISQKSSSSPICLGKNKILLTNVKFPHEMQKCPLPLSPNIPIPKPTRALPIPNGVQLVLLNNGQLTFTVDPGAQIEPQQLSALPEIMTAVQQQLASTSIPVAPNASTLSNDNICPTELVSLPDNIVYNNTVVGTLSNNIKLNASTNEEEGTDVQVEPDGVDNLINAEGITNVPNNLVENVTIGSGDIEEPVQQNLGQQQISNNSTTKDNNKQNTEVETIDLDTTSNDNNINESSKNNDNTILNTNRKTLLSDLMEMSGISAEDATSSLFPAIVPQESNNTISVPDLVPLEKSGISSVDAKIPLHAENVSQESNILIPVPDLISIHNNTPYVNPIQDMPDLSPVTSFAELKYACDRNGLFFKLDFESGIIVPINVCIKKNPKNHKQNNINFGNIVPKEVIDLTEDIDFTSEDRTPQRKLPLILNKRSLETNNRVKPLKMFKSIHSRSLLRVKTRATELNRDSTTNIDELNHKILGNRKRKQDFNHIDAKIDLVDSDSSVEEEFLLDSLNSDSDTQNHNSEDSSDDEPLINKAKRKKSVNECTQDKKSNENIEAVRNRDEQGNILEESQSTAGSEFEKLDDEMVDDNAWTEVDSATDAPVDISFLNNDGDEEDCILGV